MSQSEKLRQKQHTEHEEALKKLCLVNGLSYEEITAGGSDISSLEIFFSGFPCMFGLYFFPNLCQLTIVDQNIECIEGLECCPLLKELWIVQCHLTEISGLQKCQELEKLYLYDNQIREIKNLEVQVKLQVLWLNNNCITKIEGLNTLQTLKELNLADNIIEKIGHSLDPNVNLEILNLSGNKISSFKELTLLTHLLNLRELALQDPTSTPNPVCMLSNYLTHILYHLPSLQRLDDYEVSDQEIKTTAESAAIKKMMYYNMRVRTAQRNLAETQRVLLKKKESWMQLPEESIRSLSHALKSLERERFTLPYKKSDCDLEAESAGSNNLHDGGSETSDSSSQSRDPVTEQKIVPKIEALKERLNIWMRRIDEIEACYEQELLQATNQMEYLVQFLLMELESVGNIRLEEGQTSDPWFTSCRDLLLSRFSPSDYETFNITDIQINSVFRIHNSALRLRFEEKLQSLLAWNESVTSPNYRYGLDYLFYMTDPEICEKEDTLCILEEGFKRMPQQILGGEDAIPLSNSLGVTEQPRIKYALRQITRNDSNQSSDSVPFKHGHVIVSKVFVGNSVDISDADLTDRSIHHKVCSVYRYVDTRHRSAASDDVPWLSNTHTDQVYVPRRRQWFVFDHELVLPEYIMYFEYITGKREELSHFEDEDRSLVKDVTLNKAVLNMEPELKQQPMLLSVNNKILLSAARVNLLSQITVLNLHGNSLSKIKEVSSLPSLRHLTISFNKFTSLSDVSHIPRLECLDASFNQITTLEGLRGLGQLKQLDVSWNKLTKVKEDTAVLRKHAPALLELDTRHNPWNRPESVRMIVLGHLTNLLHLDGDVVSEEEAAEAQLAASFRMNQETLLAHSRTSSERPRSLSLLSTAQLLFRLSPAPWGPGKELEPDWRAKITALNLDNQKISKLWSMSELVNLRWASFDDNDISKLVGLDSCLKLEELSMNNNSISSLSGLPGLCYLNKLSMDGNKLSSLDASVLDQLPNLTFLSVENNCITSLHEIQNVRTLLELYIGGNQICTSRNIYYLKGLTNLIILDLYGNPFVKKLENYRIYVVFHLPSLKALDGIPVDLSECESAKNMFRGRLTTDTVAEKLGHSNYAEITYLSLPYCSIRMVDLSPAELFSNLRSVNLENNHLTSFSGLIHLPNIKALSLNYNHVESILPRQKTHLTNKQMLHNKVHSSGYGQQSLSKSSRDTGPTGSLEPLMGSLEVLHLSHNGISNMANLQLSRLTNLKALFLQGNEISQVEGLEGLQQLRELVLNKNRIKTLTKNSFTAQNVLVELHLAENRIRELNHLSPLTELRKLFLDMNKLQDITELEKLDVLPSLTELSVVGNPVARNSLHRPAVVFRLNQLQVLDGLMVTLEERTRAEFLNIESPQNYQHLGASFLVPERNLNGLLSILPYNTGLRGTHLGGGLQNYMHRHDTLLNNADENQYTHKYKNNNVGQTSQMTSNFRLNRNRGNNLPTIGAPSEGNRVISTFFKLEQDSRSPCGGKPPPT